MTSGCWAGWTNDLLHQELLRRGAQPAGGQLAARMSEFIHGQLAYVNRRLYPRRHAPAHDHLPEYCQMLFEEFERRLDRPTPAQ